MDKVIAGIDWQELYSLLLNKQFSDSVSTALRDLERNIQMN